MHVFRFHPVKRSVAAQMVGGSLHQRIGFARHQ
jgi:hypothetical protein